MPSPTLALLLSLSLAGAPGPDEDARLQAARDDYKSDRFAPAAWAFEALAKDYPQNAKYHYFAGLARENAGHDTHAFIHLRQFLASDAGTKEEREIAGKRLAAIAKRTTPVRVTLPAGADASTLQITYTGPKPTATMPKLSVTLDVLTRKDAAYELALAPGRWDLELSPREIGDQRVETTHLEVQAGEPIKFTKFQTSPILHELELMLGPAKAVRKGITVRLRRLEGSPEPRTLTTKTGTAREALLPGTWLYEAEARGFRATQGQVSVDKPSFETVTLVPRIDPDERRRRLKLGLGLAGAGLVTGAVGAGLLVFSEQALPDKRSETPGFYVTKKVVPLRNLGDTGAGLLGATLGLLVGAASSAAKKPSTWRAEIILGALASAGGVLGYGFAVAPWNPYLKTRPDEVPEFLIENRFQPLVSTAALGLGMGLIGSGTAGLLSLKSRKEFRVRASLVPSATPRHYGAILRLSF